MFRVPTHCNAPMNTSPAHMSILPPGLCFGDASNCQQMWGPGPSLLTADREVCQIKRYMGNKTGQAGFAFKFHQLPLEGHHFALGIHPSATSESHSQYQKYITYITFSHWYFTSSGTIGLSLGQAVELWIALQGSNISHGGKRGVIFKMRLGYVRSQVCSLLNFVVVVVDLSISNLQGFLELGYQLSRR